MTALTIPVDSYGEQPTCLCGLGADGMGSCTWAPIDLSGVPTIVSWSHPRAGEAEVCLDCGLVVQMVKEPRLATVADALSWTNEAQEVVFEYPRRELFVWPVVDRIKSWTVDTLVDANGATDNAQGYLRPSLMGKY